MESPFTRHLNKTLPPLEMHSPLPSSTPLRNPCHSTPPPEAVGRHGNSLVLIPLGKTPPRLATVNGGPLGGQEVEARRVPLGGLSPPSIQRPLSNSMSRNTGD